jgi:hypothetical protein
MVAGHPSDGAAKTYCQVPLVGVSPYILIGERMEAISGNPSSFDFPIFTFLFSVEFPSD